jgi:hypothetical protein
MASQVCGCFYCCQTFCPCEIDEWIDEPAGAPIESEVFVASSLYGTRSSTVIILDGRGGILFVEQSYWR